MAADSKIEWTDHTFNTHWGCSKVSPGCDGCYAERLAARFGYGWGDDAPKREFDEKHWEELLRWDRSAQAEGVRRRVFTNSMSDLFDKFAPAGVRERHFGYIERTPNLDHLLLTKRIGNAARMVPQRWLEPGGWPTNAWLGATIVNQEEADRDIPKLLVVPAAKRFLSMEPLLGPVDLTRIMLKASDAPDLGKPPVTMNALRGWFGGAGDPARLDWVIVGGESGPGARPMHPDWARSLRDQCQHAGVSFLFKQWGEWASTWHAQIDPELTAGKPYQHVMPMCRINGTNDSAPNYELSRVGKKAAGRVLDGRTWDQFPEGDHHA